MRVYTWLAQRDCLDRQIALLLFFEPKYIVQNIRFFQPATSEPNIKIYIKSDKGDTHLSIAFLSALLSGRDETALFFPPSPTLFVFLASRAIKHFW